MNAPETFSLEDDPTAEAAADILDRLPEVQEHAIQQHEAAAAQADADVPRDIDGVPFDPKIHTGTQLKNGRWRMRRGAVAGSTVGKSRRESATQTVDPQAEKRALLESQSRAAGAVAAASVFMIGRALGGREWEPRTDPVNEVEMMQTAFGDYFVAKGVNDFPPGVALTVALAMYAAPRFAMPETQTRMQRFKSWVSLRIARRRLRAELRRQGIDAQVTIKDGALYVNGQPAEKF